MTDIHRNWAGNITYAAKTVHTPRSVEELCQIVAQAQKLRALGSRHSFNHIADTPQDLVSMRNLDRVLKIDKHAKTATVEGGITYGQLAPQLQAEGYALFNLASLPHISIAGAIMTATHGSGNNNKNLAAAVAALKLVTANGDILSLARGDEAFDGAVISLGALGVVSELTLDIEPSFDVRQNLYLDLPVTTFAEHFDAISASAYSVSFFNAYKNDTIGSVWLKQRVTETPHLGDLFGAIPADRPVHPIPALDATPCTEQLGTPGPWHERLAHFRNEFTPSAGAELQTEYFVPRSHAVDAFMALHAVQDQFAPLLMIGEIRTIAADNFWMSPCYETDCVAFHFTWHQDWPAVQKVLPIMEAALAPFGARPHWGKLFTMPSTAIHRHFPRLDDFRALIDSHDPSGKFRNEFIAGILG